MLLISFITSLNHVALFGHQNIYLVILTYSSEAHYRTSADSSLSVLSRINIGKTTKNNKITKIKFCAPRIRLYI